MLIFVKERLVLLAVPKTGTTALEAALAPRAGLVLRDPPQIKHAPLYRYRRFVEPMLRQVGAEGFETLAVLREPVDWLGSWWRYRRRADLAGTPASTADVDFAQFVSDYARARPPPHAGVGSQARFIAGAEGIGVTHLFRHDRMPELMRFLEDRLGPLPKLQRLNVSPPMPLELPQGVLARLHRRRPEEFEAWRAACQPVS
ncbi:gamma-glutamyl kinase [Pseudoroseicyclus aestuarii]|uniref:Gamma-glutamyl kinase n=1 Tax=Pseudoroseicyclus aestuarii TaxID=1795041 RepID=A0A318SZU0_9RHOB|nr:gamma-glutamyl kinase [Pseudoroseicyclus aestuarii]PYE85946.1 hypothetical protein DFP88_101620 [Pseudoroseicyclus aestuarii]